MKLVRHLSLLAFTLLWSASTAQSPRLGDSRMKTAETLRTSCRNFNDYMRKSYGRDPAATLFEKGDTLMYRVSSADEARYTLTFSNDQCVEIRLELSCLPCLQLEYRKDLFKGKWRVEEDGYLYRLKNPARASIRRAVDCPFLYEVDVRRMEVPLPKDSFRRMKRVKKKWLGTLDSVLREN